MKHSEKLNALRNAITNLKLVGYTVHEWTKKGTFHLTDDEGTSLTGAWSYDKLNHFIMGYGKAFNKFKNTNNEKPTNETKPI